jgi:signal transduction histidine kinase/CheY-like chemotaxis protein
MLDFFSRLFDTTGFPPRWLCGSGWTPAHGWLHVLSDVAIWAAYFTIPGILVYFAARKRDLPFRAVFLLFGAFILACGTTHLIDATIFWWPAYRFSGLVKFITAVVSWATVFALIPNVPRVLAMRSPESLEKEVQERTSELHDLNSSLRSEIGERKRAERRVHFLAEASEVLVMLVDLASTLHAVAKVAVPKFAEWCLIDLDGDGDSARTCVALHADAGRQAKLDQLRDTLCPDEAQFSNPHITADDAKAARLLGLDEAGTRTYAELHSGSLLCIPLAIRTRTIGRLLFASGKSRPAYDQADLEVAADLGRRLSIAVDNARLHGQLRDADRRKDEFLAMLGHELRNPLAPVRNALTILKDFDGDAEMRRELLPIMTRQVEHMVHMVDDLLDVSRIMRGRIELRIEPVALAEVVTRAVESVRPICDERRQSIVVALPERAVMLRGDVVRLCQVLVNLLQNASKYSPEGSRIDISAKLETGGVAVSVRDRGVGIDPSLLPRVFDLFTQSERTIERAQGGLGIGLTVVRSIVEMHGGSVEARSDGPDRGAEFTVRLAVADDAAPATVAPPLLKPADMPRLKVLIVEDNVGAARTLAALVEKFWNHETHVVHDGLGAIDAADAFGPDVIFLDIGLPGLSGYDVARRLREKPEFARTLIVALTGYGQAEDKRRSREAGFDEHLIKPVAAAALEPLFLRATATR